MEVLSAVTRFDSDSDQSDQQADIFKGVATKAAMAYETGDHVGSDEVSGSLRGGTAMITRTQMDYILELSRNDALPKGNQSSSRPHAPGSTQNNADEPSYLAKTRIQNRIGALDSEIASIEDDIAQLAKVKSDLLKEKRELQSELDSVDSKRFKTRHDDNFATPGNTKQKENTIDYMEEFDWSSPLKIQMKRVFGIDSFRLCQEGYVLYFVNGEFNF